MVTIPRALVPALRALVNGVRRVSRYLHPATRAADAATRAARRHTDQALRELTRQGGGTFSGEVLIDSQWDNPNYWLRVSLLRTALGLPNGREIGVLGEFRRDECIETLTTLGIPEHVVFGRIEVEHQAIAGHARRLVAATRSADDVLAWELPEEVPAAMVYDGILKRQRLASLDVERDDFEPLVVEALTGIARAKLLLDQHDFKLVIISHPLNFTYGSIAYQALRRGIPVILPFGLFGVLRMTYMRQPQDLTAFYDRPTRDEIDGLEPFRAEALREIGRRYLAGRFGGKADDLASVYAYQRQTGSVDREELCRRFGWNPAKPIVGFYASNWYDWPHQLGMTAFRDFLDWTEATFEVAGETPAFNWLFKPHPCEEWFGGVALSEILARMPTASNIAIADKQWNNTAVMQCLDALVTYHGTAGIEFASLGRPVLVPDKGKYDDCGFVKVAADRQEYIDLLRTEWWAAMDLDDARRRAEIFAGWWFCAPDWQGDFLLADDSRQDELYGTIPSLLAENPDQVRREIDGLRHWLASGHMYSHTYKMMHADAYRLSNIG